MVDEFLSLDYGESECIVSRSRFLGYAFFIENEDDAIKKLADLRSKYSDATHICYAYVADAGGSCIRFSDDGEPNSTAGAPILEAIKSKKLFKVLIAVVRYFGGTKLGTGGLVRAYFGCASLAADNAKKSKHFLCNIVEFCCDFVNLSRLQDCGEFKILTAEYSSNVFLRVAFKYGFDYKAFLDALTNRKTQTKLLETKYIVF